MRRALFCVALVLVQLLGCLSPLSMAYAAETKNIDNPADFSTNRHQAQYLNSYGNIVQNFDMPRAFVDSDDVEYWCVEPHTLIALGTFSKADISDMLNQKTVKKCGVATWWCHQSENIPTSYAGFVTQVFIWKILYENGYSHNGTVTDYALDDYNTKEAWSEFNDWYDENAIYYEGYGTLWTHGSNQKLAHFWAERTKGYVSLMKVSSNKSITSDNDCYSLAGATYGIWTNKACTESAGVDDLVTKASGVSNEVLIDIGTYWVKEKEAPKGYKLDSDAHKVVVEGKETNVIKLTDEPEYDDPEVWVSKYDAQIKTAQGDATLEGAEFTISYYDGMYTENNLPSSPERTWIVSCDKDGAVIPSASARVGGDEFYYDEDNNIVFPRGTIVIQETKAPTGYFLEGQTPSSGSSYTAPLHVFKIEGDGSFETPDVYESVIRGGVKLGKIDAERDGATPQGDATLAGAVFAITLKSSQSVQVGSTTYGQGQVVMRITTNEYGAATTGNQDLPYGTYTITEETPSTGYLKNSSFSKTFTVRTNGTIVDAGSSACEEKIIRGGVAVGKISRETGQHLSQGEAELSGATFSITLESNNPVLVGGKLYKKGQVVHSITTNNKGIASTDAQTLPYGTYSICEVEAPAGFLLNESWSRTVQIRENGKICDLTGESVSADDQVMRGSFGFNKVEESSMERMGNTAFRITSTSTQESHVVVTDENGLFDTETYPHSNKTNANDGAVLDNGTVDEDALDPEAGVWFSGRSDYTVSPNDSFMALPYDVYTVEELSTSANENNRLVSFTVRIHKDTQHLDMGTIDNESIPEPSIATTLTFDGSDHLAPVCDEVTLVDTVTYTGLVPNTEYEMAGTLMSGSTGEALADADGNPVTASVVFTPKSSSGSVGLSFTFSSAALAGSSVVAFEELKCAGHVTCEHKDPGDEDQTVRFPSVGTTLADENDNHEVSLTQTVKLVDTVSYANLIPGRTYEVSGTLMDKGTGEPLRDENDAPITSSSSFVAKESDGVAKVTFAFSGSVGAGKKLVAFERLLRAGIELASHEDIDDEGQTITIPSVRTEIAHDATVTTTESDTIELRDTVLYEGLVVGKTYDIQGTLADKATGELIKDAQGNEITATTTMEAKESSGSTEVVFNVPASLLMGKEVVAYETLERDKRELVVHANLEDEAQTARVPSIATTLHDAQDDHEVCAASEVKLVDTVSYSGLKPGSTYTLVGTLMDRETGEELVCDGKEVTASATFVPEQATGTVDITFAFDGSLLGNKTLVAFETLCKGEGDDLEEVARHADIEDEGQTVYVPDIQTQACDGTDSDRKITSKDKAIVKDTVTYLNLTPGKEYVMKGTLHDKKTGQPLERTDGSTVTSELAFTPKKRSGTVELTFEFDVSLVTGTAVVAYETCYAEEKAIAVHADINDKAQTVEVVPPSEEKEEEDKPDQKKTSTPTAQPWTALAQAITPGTGDATVSPFVLVLIGILALGGAVAYASYRRYGNEKH